MKKFTGAYPILTKILCILALILSFASIAVSQTKKASVKTFKTDTLDVSAISSEVLEIVKTTAELSRIEMVIIIENGNVPTATANSIMSNNALANSYYEIDGSDYRTKAKIVVSQNKETNNVFITYKGSDVRIKRVYRVVVGIDTKILFKTNTKPNI